MAKPRPSDIATKFFTAVNRAKNPEMIYFLHGEESYLLDHAVQAVIELAAPDGLNDFNYDAFHAKSTSGDTLRAAVETLPFMCKRRVVLLRDLQEMDLKQLDALDDYFSNPSPTTCLIIHAMTAEKKVDGRLGIVRKLKKASESCEFKSFYQEDVEDFIHKRARHRNMRLERDSVAYLSEAVGSKLADLDAALEKLDLFVGDSEQQRDVSLAQVQEIIADTKVNTVFELTDALGERHMEQALHILEKMMLSGEAAIMINQMIARHFRIIAKLQDPSIRHAGRNERASAAGVSPFFLKDYDRHARKFSAQKVEQLLERLVDVDMLLKSSKLDDQLILEQLVFDIMASN